MVASSIGAPWPTVPPTYVFSVPGLAPFCTKRTDILNPGSGQQFESWPEASDHGRKVPDPLSEDAKHVPADRRNTCARMTAALPLSGHHMQTSNALGLQLSSCHRIADNNTIRTIVEDKFRWILNGG
jgi:hypothetical protein